MSAPGLLFFDIIASLFYFWGFGGDAFAGAFVPLPVLVSVFAYVDGAGGIFAEEEQFCCKYGENCQSDLEKGFFADFHVWGLLCKLFSW